jgi:Tol biopolymer transport system component
VSVSQFSEASVDTPAQSVRSADAKAVCEQMVSQAFADISNNCAGLEPNSICYGSGQVKTTFEDRSPTTTLLQSGDRASLTDLVSVETPALDIEHGTYGIAMLNVQANIHSAARQSVAILMFGEATLTSAVDDLSLYVPAEAIDIVTNRQTEAKSAPGTSAASLGTIETGATLQGDAVSRDGRWVRIYFDNHSAWIARESVGTDVDTLPVISDDSLSPMQSFNVQTGFGERPCEAAPHSAILVQNPTAEPVKLVVNDVPLLINSTVFIRTLGHTMRVTTGEGRAVLYPESGTEAAISAGFSIDLPLNQAGSAAGQWKNLSVLVEEVNGYTPYETLPPSILIEPYSGPGIVQASGVGNPTPTIVPAGGPGPDVGGGPGVGGPPVTTRPFPQIPLDLGTGGQDLEREPWRPFTVGGPVCPDFILYHSDRDNDWDLYRLGRGPIVNVSNGDGSSDIMPTLSNDAAWVAWSSDRNASGSWEIYVARVDGTDRQRVTYNTAVDMNPVWGPGNLLVFETNRDTNWELYLFDVSGDGKPQRLTDDSSNDINAFWAPGGKDIFFQSDRDGDYEIYRLDIESGIVTQITDNDVEDQNPIISHDGDLLAWRQANPNGIYDLWLLDLGTEELIQLTDLGVSIASQEFSPDDSFLAFHARDAQDFDVFVVEIDTLTIKNLNNNTDFQDVAPNFRCGSGNVIYHSDFPGQREIYEINPLPIAGPPNAPVRLTNDEASDIYPLGDPREEISSREGRTPPRR